jgi:hypothetical protein
MLRKTKKRTPMTRPLFSEVNRRDAVRAAFEAAVVLLPDPDDDGARAHLAWQLDDIACLFLRDHARLEAAASEELKNYERDTASLRGALKLVEKEARRLDIPEQDVLSATPAPWWRTSGTTVEVVQLHHNDPLFDQWTERLETTRSTLKRILEVRSKRDVQRSRKAVAFRELCRSLSVLYSELSGVDDAGVWQGQTPAMRFMQAVLHPFTGETDPKTIEYYTNQA